MVSTSGLEKLSTRVSDINKTLDLRQVLPKLTPVKVL
jgi:hypothetical protein